MPANIEYKCRRCYEVFFAGSAPKGMPLILNILFKIELPANWGVNTFKLLNTHTCFDDGIGVADFIGVEKDK